MNKKLSYIVTIILSLFAGSALMYMLIYYFPNSIVKTESKIQKVVKVNEEGISSGIDNIYDSVVVVENYKKVSFQESVLVLFMLKMVIL